MIFVHDICISMLIISAHKRQRDWVQQCTTLKPQLDLVPFSVISHFLIGKLRSKTQNIPDWTWLGWWVLVGGLCVSNKAPAESAVIGEAAYSHFTQEPSHHSHISKYCIFLKQIKNSPFNTVSLLTFHPRTLYHAFHFNIYLILHSAEANCIHLNSLYCKVHDSSMSK